MDDKERLMSRALTRLLTSLEINGVAVVRTSDGHLYAFSKSKLEELVRSCDESKSDRIVVLVRHSEIDPHDETNDN